MSRPTSEERPAGRTTFARVREILSAGAFRRLFSARFVSQFGDGLFQLAAADVLLFEDPGSNPALKLTAIVALTLIPFSTVVPFVGVFIDRWDRRKILAYTPIGRAALALILPLTISNGNEGLLFFVIVLIVLSANRLFLATMSAVLPGFVEGRNLLLANSVAATGGSIATISGLGTGAVIAAFAGGARAALVAACAFMGAALIARRLPLRREGDRAHQAIGAELRRVLRDLGAGIRRIRDNRRVRFAFSAVLAGQALVGLTSAAITVVFVSRLGLGVGEVSKLLGVIGVGLGIGIVVVPIVARRVREDFIIPMSFAIGATGVVIASSLTVGRMRAGAVVVGMSYAFAKIPVDTIVQKEMPDHFRGRAFAVYDLLFNFARVVGTGAAAIAVEASIALSPLVRGAGIAYLFASGGLLLWARRIAA